MSWNCRCRMLTNSLHDSFFPVFLIICVFSLKQMTKIKANEPVRMSNCLRMWLPRCNIYRKGSRTKVFPVCVRTIQFTSTIVPSNSASCVSISKKGKRPQKSVKTSAVYMKTHVSPELSRLAVFAGSVLKSASDLFGTREKNPLVWLKCHLATQK